MMKTFAFAFVLSLVTVHAEARSNFLCSGKHSGQSIVMNGTVENVTDPKSGKGTISVDGRDVADFEGVDAKINYIFMSFKVQNSRGEIFEGKVTDLAKATALITRLYIPGFGIDFKNIQVTCVER